MKFAYTEKQYIVFRKSFLDQYSLVNDINLFNEVEDAFHVWIGMDHYHLNYFQHTTQFERTFHYLHETIERLTAS